MFLLSHGPPSGNAGTPAPAYHAVELLSAAHISHGYHQYTQLQQIKSARLSVAWLLNYLHTVKLLTEAWLLSVQLNHTPSLYRVQKNKVAPKVFRCFLSNRLEF